MQRIEVTRVATFKNKMYSLRKYNFEDFDRIVYALRKKIEETTDII
jgi:hypothetical protein